MRRASVRTVLYMLGLSLPGQYGMAMDRLDFGGWTALWSHHKARKDATAHTIYWRPSPGRSLSDVSAGRLVDSVASCHVVAHEMSCGSHIAPPDTARALFRFTITAHWIHVTLSRPDGGDAASPSCVRPPFIFATDCVTG